MKICLINPPVEMKHRSWYPIGIGYVAASLVNSGFKVEIIDVIGENLSRENFKKRLADCQADCFGIGGLLMAFNNVVDISRMIRELYPDSFIFAGNTVASTIPEILLHNTPVQAIVMGEGEITTVNLIKSVDNRERLEDVKGIVFKNSKGEISYNSPQPPIENLDDLPYPAWDLLPMNKYINTENRTYPISSVRGCPFNCIFCCKTFIGYKVRSRSPESIIKELIEVKKRFDIDRFTFFDDLFLYNKGRAIKFCELKNESPLKDMEWDASVRVDRLDEELIIALKNSRCFEIGIGFESACQPILDFYNKRITVEQSQKAVDLCRKYSLSLGGSSFLIGAPNETYESVKASIDFCKRNHLRYEPHFVTPYPKTPLYDYALQKGLIKDELEYIKQISRLGNTNYLAVNLTNNFTDDELINLRDSSIYFPQPSIKSIIDHIPKGFHILKTTGPKEVTYRAIHYLSFYLKTVMNSLYPPKREKYSNEWI